MALHQIANTMCIVHRHQDWTDINEGWLYGEWETGPWLGLRQKDKAFGTYGWVC